MHYLWRIYSKFFYLLYNYTVFLHKLSPICNGYEKSEELGESFFYYLCSENQQT